MSTKSVDPAASEDQGSDRLNGASVAIVGKLAGMSRREAQQLIRRHGGAPVDEPSDSTDILVWGEAELPLAPEDWDAQFNAATRQAVEEGRIELISETQLWQRLGLVESEQNVRRLYTPAMLADLLQVPVAIVRRWHRRGLIVPAREVRRLPYFDFQEVATARRLAELLASGMSPQSIEKKLAELARYMPGIERPLAQLSVIVEGKHLLLRQGDGLIAPGGQLWFDFAPADETAGATATPADAGDSTAGSSNDILSWAERAPAAMESPSPEELLSLAAALEDEGQLETAANMYRAAMAAGGPTPQVCFALAELLYRLGDATAARERYFMAIELDEEYVEARANLGCVLAELGERELAVAAFEGALAFHGDYPDVHFHLARLLDDIGRGMDAAIHWRAFLVLAPESPWAEAARLRLSDATL